MKQTQLNLDGFFYSLNIFSPGKVVQREEEKSLRGYRLTTQNTQVESELWGFPAAEAQEENKQITQIIFVPLM